MPGYQPVQWARQTADGRQAQADGGRLLNFYAVAAVNPEEADVPVVLQGTPGYTSQLQLGSNASDDMLGYILIADDANDSDQALILQSNAATVINSTGAQASRLSLTRPPYAVDGVVSMATDGKHVIFPSGSGANAGITILDIADDGTLSNERYLFDDKANTTPFSVAWIDGYFIIAMEEGKVYHLQREETVFNRLDNAYSTELNGESLVHMVALHKMLYLFFEKTIELWAQAGKTSFTFQKNHSFYPSVGCQHGHRNTITVLKERIAFRGHDDIIYDLTGAQIRRISNEAVEYAIRQLRDGSRQSGFTYVEEGHEFYGLVTRLTSADISAGYDRSYWCFDVTTNLWHERSDMNDLRHIVRLDSSLIALPYDSNRVLNYGLNYASNQFDGAAQRAIREAISPVVRSRLQRFNIASFQVQVDRGKVQYDDDDLITMEWTDDGKNSWHWLGRVNHPDGPVGKKMNQPRLKWNALGQSREGRNFRVRVNSDKPVSLLSAYIDFQRFFID